jgi:glycerophosphoryl diester phosphodiesterase
MSVHIIAHRGNSACCPENTRAAFLSALAAGARLVEWDVRITSDGQVAVIHDATLERTTDGRGRVAEHTLDELGTLSAGFGERFGTAFAAERIPSLIDALALVRGRAWALIELKKEEGEDDRLERAVIAAVRAQGLEREVALISFHYAALARCLQLAPEIRRAPLVYEAPAEAIMRVAQALRSEVVLPRKTLVTAELCACLHAAGVHVATWVVDDVDELRQLAALGVVGAGTNRPNEMLTHFPPPEGAAPIWALHPEAG